MGKASRDKGARREREMVERLNSLPGVSANRVPLSGAARGFKGDIKAFFDALQRVVTVEVKARKTAIGWTVVKQWLRDNDLMLLVEDRQEPLVVMPWGVFQEFCGGGEYGDFASGLADGNANASGGPHVDRVQQESTQS